MRLVGRLLAVLCGLVAVGVAFSAAEAGADDPCRPAALGAVSISPDGQEGGAAVLDDDDCAPAAPSGFAAVNCARNGIDVAVRNTGGIETAVLIRVNGLDTRRFEVPGGAERSTLLDFAEDLPITIEVFADGEVILERTFRPDCFPEPAAPTIAVDCAAGGAAVTLDNPTSEPMKYVVVVDGAKTDVVVGAHRVERYDVAIGEDTERLIAVMADETTQLARATVRRDCERPRASVALDCDSSSAVFTLGNDGVSVAMVDLKLDGAVVVTIPVPGGEERLVVRLDATEDRPTLLSATSTNAELVAERLTLDCEPAAEPGVPLPTTSAPAAPVSPVASATPTPPTPPPPRGSQVLGVSARRAAAPTATTLPATGSDSLRLVAFAVMMLALGVACVCGSTAVSGRAPRVP